MRLAITGSKGQLGTALQSVLAPTGELLLIDVPEFDITNLEQMLRALAVFRPDVVIHAAALTNVDGCETDPEAAYRVNVLGTRNVAVATERSGASLAYISTDYVFDGTKDGPYWEYDDPNPLSVYARTKYIGEQLAQRLTPRHYVVRIAWLYGPGPRNFVATVLRLARESGSLRMVTDESGSPTNASDVAAALGKLVRAPAFGIYHLPNAGVCSRYEWAHEILDLAGLRDVELNPATNYQRAARVPKRVVLRNCLGANLGIVMRPWREALRDYVVGHPDYSGR